MKSLNFPLNVNQQRWRALVIHVIGSVTQLPGAVHLLANMLSVRGISILHISTFEREIFLVQEHDLDVACELLKKATSSNEFIMSSHDMQPKLRAPTSESDNFILKVLPGFVLLVKLRDKSDFDKCGDILVIHSYYSVL